MRPNVLLKVFLFFIFCVFNLKELKAHHCLYPSSSIILETGESLDLNGTGYGKALRFVKIYKASLYLENSSDDPYEILNSNSVKYLKMCFLRDISRQDIINEWVNGLRKAGYIQLESSYEIMNYVLSNLVSVKKNQIMSIKFVDDKTTVFLDNNMLFSVTDMNFSYSVLYSYLYNPPNWLGQSLLGVNF